MPRMFTLVDSESGDWYIIPIDFLEAWNEKYSFEEPPHWATYVQHPSWVRFYDWEVEQP